MASAVSILPLSLNRASLSGDSCHETEDSAVLFTAIMEPDPGNRSIVSVGVSLSLS